MRKFYNILFTIGFVASSPIWFLRLWRRGNWARHFKQRFGKYDARVKQALTNTHTLWIHAVSVGEANLCIQLIPELQRRMPNMKIVVSTTTTTGMGELKKRLPSQVLKIYYPVDRRRCVQRALSIIRPEAILLIEAEIWPNFLWRAEELNIPVFLINARISDRSFKGYKRFGFLFRSLFNQLAGAACPTREDGERLKLLGVPEARICVAGNVKWDTASDAPESSLDIPGLLERAGAGRNPLVLVAGSTHAGEEGLLARIFKSLKAEFPNLFLVVVPRHFERAREAARDIRQAGVRVVYRTEPDRRTGRSDGKASCLLVNTTGELRDFYRHADLVFIGKSLLAEGGQNPIEPAALGKAVLCGPQMQNFTLVVEALKSEGGIIQIGTEEELRASISELLRDEDRRRNLGQRARDTVRKHSGALERTVAMVAETLSEKPDLYVAPLPDARPVS